MAREYKIAWDDGKLGFSVPLIDRQHQELVALANVILEGARERKPADYMDNAINELLRFVRQHFALEESLMARYHYPGHPRHAQEHRRQLEDLGHFLGGLGRQPSMGSEFFVAFLNDWIELHILSQDRDFAQYLKEKKGRIP